VCNCKISGRVYYLLLDQLRVTTIQKKTIKNAPRGYGETNVIEDVIREGLEEIGIAISPEKIRIMGYGNPDTGVFVGATVAYVLVVLDESSVHPIGDNKLQINSAIV